MTYPSVRILTSSLVSLIAAIMAGLSIANPVAFAAWVTWPAIIVSVVTLALTIYWFTKQELTKVSVLALIFAGLSIPTLLGGAYATMSTTNVVVDDTNIIAPAPAESNLAAAPTTPEESESSALPGDTPATPPAVATPAVEDPAASASSTSAPLTPEQAAAADAGAGATNDNLAQEEIPDSGNQIDVNEPDLPAATFEDEGTK